MTASDRCVSVHNKMRAADKKSTARAIKPFNKACLAIGCLIHCDSRGNG